ncbi:MAG: CatB-related O-acetyltransferase, partial [Planctomycetes bacterium]|nr:CatB-related O-acetyltransferase [Planctomycetota bacterium]
SQSAFRCIQSHTLDENVPCLLRIGRMGNVGQRCTLLVDGEHKNDQIVNIEFMQFPMAYQKLRSQGQWTTPIRAKGLTQIGHNVLLSHGVTVLSGVTIGNGAVIGANSVVTRDIPPFAVAAGNPARVLHYRFDEGTIEAIERIRWWDLDFGTLFDNASKMQSLSTEAFIEYFDQFGPEHYVDDRRKFVFSVLNERHDIQCIGCDIDGEFRSTESLNTALQFYVNQIKPPLPQIFYQVPDILSCQVS